MANEKESKPGGDKIISGARTGGQICEAVNKYVVRFLIANFLLGLGFNLVADGRISYNNKKRRKEDKNG